MRSGIGGFLLLIGFGGHSIGEEPLLPPVELRAEEPEKLPSVLKVLVREFRFEGNTVFSKEDLAKVTAPYLNREINNEELEEARRALTLHYVNQGFINSGAILPDQDLPGGVITFRIIEGALSEVKFEGNKRLRSSYLRKRIEHGAGHPLNVNNLKDKLEVIKQNPNIKAINAELKPGDQPGQNNLDVKVVEKSSFDLGFQFSNRRSPSIGAERFELLASCHNVTGFSDGLGIRYGITTGGLDGMEFAGLDDFDVSYSVPVNAYDTTLGLSYGKTDSLVIEEPFAEMDIASESSTYGVSLRHPVHKTVSQEFALSVTGEHRRNETSLLGQPFSFSPGAEDGESKVTVLRFGQDWVYRNQKHVIAARSTISFAINAFEPTKNGAGEADGRFFSWLGQFLYVRRLWDTNNQVIFRVNTQIANESLLSLEQFSIGGGNTVRGYRENQLVRDNGVVSSLEFRIPVLNDKKGEGILFLSPFFDFGYGWSVKVEPASQDLTSAGIGLLFHLGERVEGHLYWGYAFRDFETSGDDLQDQGIHFQLTVWAF